MKRTHLPLNALRVFDAAARHLSFTRAADELAVTPAAVGQQIRALPLRRNAQSHLAHESRCKGKPDVVFVKARQHEFAPRTQACDQSVEQ